MRDWIVSRDPGHKDRDAYRNASNRALSVVDDVNTIAMAYTQVIGFFTNPFVILTALVAAALLPVLAGYYFAAQRPKDFPPGPPTIPFLGNLHLLPLSKSFLKYTCPHANPYVQSSVLIASRFDEWANEYGPIVGLKFGPQNVVVLNNYHHVKE